MLIIDLKNKKNQKKKKKKKKKNAFPIIRQVGKKQNKTNKQTNKKTVKRAQAKLVKCEEKTNVGSLWTPGHLSIKNPTSKIIINK